MRSLRVLLPLLALAMLALPAQAGAVGPGSLYHIVSARVSTDWSFNYSWLDDQNQPASTSGGEATSLTLLRTIDRGADPFGIYTALLKGSINGSYHLVTTGNTVDCPHYSFDPVAIQEQVQLDFVRVRGGRLEINAGVGPGQAGPAVLALQSEMQQVATLCGQMPPALAFGLTYGPAPNNVHTPQCDGIAHGCELFNTRRLHARRVTIHIHGSGPVDPDHTHMPSGASGYETYSWDIKVMLQRPAGRRH